MEQPQPIASSQSGAFPAQWLPVRPIRLSSWLHVAILVLLAWAGVLRGAEVIPAAPKNHFNDFAKVVPASTAAQLNTELETFEKRTSIQFVVAIYPRMESNSSIEDYTVRVAEAWKVGRKEQDNGVVLFVFIQNKQMRIQVGYGLEGALPDATAKQIIETHLKPNFRTGNYERGFREGVTAIMQATQGEYVGTGRTMARRGKDPWSAIVPLFLFAAFIGIQMIARTRRGGQMYNGRGRRRINGPFIFPMGGGFGGGRGGGGGFSGGSFGGGGGSFGGGGAGGSW